MDLRRLTYFIKVLELGSFTKAAEQLRIAQPALGIQIRKLESELETPLLIRHSRGVEPTEAGSILAGHVYELLRHVERVKQAMRDHRGPVRGRVVVGAHSTAQFISSALIKRSRVELPTISLNIVEGAGAVLLEGVEDERIEIAYSYRRAPAKGGDIIFEELLHDHLVIVGMAGTGKPPADTITFGEMANLPLILPGRSRTIRERVESAAEAGKLSLDIIFDGESEQLAKELVRQNLGYSVMPSGSVRHEVQTGEFFVRRIVEPEMTVNLYLMHKETGSLSRPALAIRDLILSIAEEEKARFSKR